MIVCVVRLVTSSVLQRMFYSVREDIQTHECDEDSQAETCEDVCTFQTIECQQIGTPGFRKAVVILTRMGA